MLAAHKRRLVAVTIEYGAVPPAVPGRQVDWEHHVLRPAERLMAAAEQHAVPLTFMPEMGRYRSLLQSDEPVARRMERQWRDAVARGHDVQLQLHPGWLHAPGAPGSGHEPQGAPPLGSDPAEASELAALIGDFKARLEALLCSVDPDYAVSCFRVGGYGAQRLAGLYEALESNGIGCDSSVLAGGVSREHGYDYRVAYSNHQPYFASATDPQLRAPPAERALVELPIFTDGGGTGCCLDDDAARRFAAMLLRHVHGRGRRPAVAERRRIAELLRSAMFALYLASGRFRPAVNRLVPRPVAHWLTPLYPPEALAGHEYFVLNGRTAAGLDLCAIGDGFRRLREDGQLEFVRLSEMARAARDELGSAGRADPRAEAEHQVAAARPAVLSDERNERQSAFLQQRIPPDRTRILDLGCGAGYWADRIARRHPRAHVTGVDWGRDFIDVAARRYGSDRVEFRVADFADLPFDDGSFDCVYADNVLEHAYDVDAVLREVHRVLGDGGVLVAAVPSDARNPRRSNENHTWKTAPHDVRARLERAGFRDVEIVEQDAFRRFAIMPYPPSNDRMMFVRAWRRARALDGRGGTMDAMARLRAMTRSPYAPEPPRRHIAVDAALALVRRVGRTGTATPHVAGGSDEAKVRWEYEGAPAFLALLRAYGVDGLFEGAVVLDAGCGWGGKALYFAENCRPAEVNGFDIPGVFDPAVPETIARERGIANCSFTTGFAEQMPFASGAVDLVIMEDVLEHVRDPERTLAECARVLRPGGHAVIKFPSFRMVYAHHLERALQLPGLQYVLAMKTWAAGLNDALLRDPGLGFEPFSEVVATRYHAAVTRDLNGLDFRSFRTLVEHGPWESEVLALVPHHGGVAERPIVRACYGAALKVGPLREPLSATVLFVGRRR